MAPHLLREMTPRLGRPPLCLRHSGLGISRDAGLMVREKMLCRRAGALRRGVRLTIKRLTIKQVSSAVKQQSNNMLLFRNPFKRSITVSRERGGKREGEREGASERGRERGGERKRNRESERESERERERERGRERERAREKEIESEKERERGSERERERNLASTPSSAQSRCTHAKPCSLNTNPQTPNLKSEHQTSNSEP